MSTQQQSQDASPEEMIKAAMDVVYENVFCPVFFHKLAEHGIRPGTEDEATELLKMGENLLALSVEQQVKQANSRASQYAAINNQITKSAGHSAPQFSFEEDRFVSEVLADPQIKLASDWLVAASS